MIMNTCWSPCGEICGEPSTEYSSGQPQSSAHGQRIWKHCPRFPCPSTLQRWWSPYDDDWWEDWESGTYPIHSGMSRVFQLPQHSTSDTSYATGHTYCTLRKEICIKKWIHLTNDRLKWLTGLNLQQLKHIESLKSKTFCLIIYITIDLLCSVSAFIVMLKQTNKLS